jgi:hypothetical protein
MEPIEVNTCRLFHTQLGFIISIETTFIGKGFNVIIATSTAVIQYSTHSFCGFKASIQKVG